MNKDSLIQVNVIFSLEKKHILMYKSGLKYEGNFDNEKEL